MSLFSKLESVTISAQFTATRENEKSKTELLIQLLALYLYSLKENTLKGLHFSQ